MNREEDLNTITENEPLRPRTVNIECKGVFKIYKQGNLEVVALKDINLNIYAGELVVIMGPSGSGKTTLLNVISGMVKPTAGQVFVKGVDIARLKDKNIQKLLQEGIGIVFQFFNLVPSLTARGNVELPMIIANKSEEFRKKRLKELIEAVGMGDRMKHRPFALSGGEKQRVAIAAAFANNPSIILADEPTGNIDSISSDKVMDIFREFLKKNPDKSIIIATHDSNFRKIADRTLVIKDGHIILELGKADLQAEQEEQVSNNEGDISDIYKLGYGGLDRAEQSLNPAFRSIKFDQIMNCPNCHSTNIEKKYDQLSGNFQIRNNQLITRAVVFCTDCLQLNYITCALYDVRNELV